METQYGDTLLATDTCEPCDNMSGNTAYDDAHGQTATTTCVCEWKQMRQMPSHDLEAEAETTRENKMQQRRHT